MSSWSYKEVNQKIKYLDMWLKWEKNEKRRAELFFNKALFCKMLEELEGNHLHFYKDVHLLMKKTALVRKKEILDTIQEAKLDRYLNRFVEIKEAEFSLEICKNLALQVDFNFFNDLPIQDTLEEAKKFINQFPEHPIKEEYKKVVEDKDKILFTEDIKDSNYLGWCGCSTIFKESYIVSSHDPSILLHEITHAVNFKKRGFVPDYECYPLSYEIAPYALQQYYYKKINAEENFKKIICYQTRNFLANAIRGKAVISNDEIKEATLNDLNKSHQNVETLITTKNIIMASCLADQMEEEPTLGFQKFYYLVSTYLKKDRRPSYEEIGFPPEMIQAKSEDFLGTGKNVFTVKK